jgi:putative ABC transport system permease protein
MSAFKPASILKGSFKFSGKGIWLRRALVVTQFTISIALIVSTLVIYKQLSYIRNKQLGYNKENTIILPLDQQTTAVFDQLRTELMKSGRVTAVSRASEAPTEIKGGYGLVVEGATKSPDLMVTAVTVDTAFIPTFGMTLQAGRNFTENDFRHVKADTTNHSSAFIVNEMALKALSIDREQAVGTRLRLSGRSGEIVGVVNDFHFASMRKAIEPLVLFDEVEQFNYFFVRLDGRDTKASLKTVERICHQLMPHRPFEYRFVDEQYTALYDAEERMGSVFIGFASLAIIIACLGLLGLVSFSAAQKTKEIGIRKVLGATPVSIVVLVTKDFSRLIVVAIVLGLPLAYYIMTQWLSDFVYKTEIGVAPLLLAPLLCVIIAFASSAYQALRAAWVDPAETLRNE